MSLKQVVGRAAVEHFWEKFGNHLGLGDVKAATPFVLGLGSGSTVAAFWEELTRSFENRQPKSTQTIIVIPTSIQSRDLVISSCSFTYILGDIEQFPRIDFLVDGFDKIDKQGNMIKGGGAAHVLEKLVALHAAYSLYIGTADKFCQRLGHAQQESIPIEVLPCASACVERTLQSLGGSCVRRSSKGSKMGPTISDNGNILLDWIVPASSPLWEDVQLLDQRVCSLPGVLGCGLFVNLCSRALIIDENGNVSTIKV